MCVQHTNTNTHAHFICTAKTIFIICTPVKSNQSVTRLSVAPIGISDGVHAAVMCVCYCRACNAHMLVPLCACMGDTPVWKVLCDRSMQRQWGRGLTDKWEANAFRSILSWERVSGVEKREWKVVSREGGSTEGLINHSCIVIDFLLKGVSQTLNYVSVLVCMCVLYCTRCEHKVFNYRSRLRLGLAL